jgi:glucose uptake protein GlcU
MAEQVFRIVGGFMLLACAVGILFGALAPHLAHPESIFKTAAGLLLLVSGILWVARGYSEK